MDGLGDINQSVRRYLRRWLGVAAIQRQVRDLENADVSFRAALEACMAISNADIERLNAVTSRIAVRVGALLDQVDQLGTGNDDEIRAQALLEATQQSSADLRPILEQLEALGSDATQIVPDPAPEQAPVQPGPDVAPVENLPAAGGDVVTDPAPAPGDVVATPDTPAVERP